MQKKKINIFISKKMRNFILLAQTNNIAQAAKKIHITASPFNKSIAALKKQIGYTLFTRKNNNISLNKAKQKLYQKLFPIYQRLSAINNKIHNSKRHSQKIVIGINNTYPTIIFNQLISLKNKYKSVTAQPVKFSKNSVINNLFNRQLNFIISPQHVSAQIQKLKNLTISKLPPLQLGFLVSHRYKKQQKQKLLQKLPWLQMRFQNQANFKAIINANMQPCKINPTIIYRPYNFIAKISAVKRKHFLTVIPHFAWQLINPATLKYFNAPHRPMYMQKYLYSIKNHRYTATMLQHIAKNRNKTSH